MALLPLLVAMGAATAMYWPALGSGFWNDDYVYLLASRTIGLGRYVHVSLVPNSDDPNLHFVQAFWRPLYFLGFRGLHGLFGTHPLGYHLVVFGIHLLGIVVVWALAWRLTRSLTGAGAAALVFAVFPLGYDSVAWVSSLNSAAFPLSLGSWLAFTFAVDKRPFWARTGLHVAAVLLLAAGLAFRENAVSMVPVIGLWYLFCEVRPGELRRWQAWVPLLPYAALGAAYVVFRTIASRQWVTPYPIFTVGWLDVRQGWYYVRLGPLPFLELGGTWEAAARIVAGVLLLLLIPLFAATRRWLAAVLLVGFLLAIAPYSVVRGVTPRYIYFPSAFIALAAGALAAEAWERLERTSRPSGLALQTGYLGLVMLAAAGGAWFGQRRVQGWVTSNPAAEDAWVSALQHQYPTLAPGATVWAAGSPIALTLFGALGLQAAVHFYYPGVTIVSFSVVPGAGGPQPPPGALIYIYQPQEAR